MDDINPKINIAVDTLKNEILTFKKSLYFSIVADDKEHNASNMGAMMKYHSLFLHVIGYWISLLDNSSMQKPILPTKEQNTFNKLTAQIKNLAIYNSDSKILLYSMLFKYSIQHPFDLGKQIKNYD
jgi:hypothetical protein